MEGPGEIFTASEGRVDVFAVFEEGIVAETTEDGSRFDQRDVGTRAGQFQPQGIRQSLQGKFAGVVGAVKTHGRETEHRAVLHDAAATLRRMTGIKALVSSCVPNKLVSIGVFRWGRVYALADCLFGLLRGLTRLLVRS